MAPIRAKTEWRWGIDLERDALARLGLTFRVGGTLDFEASLEEITEAKAPLNAAFELFDWSGALQINLRRLLLLCGFVTLWLD